ncbi:MAG: substrate-binding domain-containing protein [Halapricum sp.]
MVRDDRRASRRTFLKVGGVSAATFAAGCLGTQDGEGPSDDGTSTPTGTPEQSIEGWRAAMKEQAREELSGDKLQVWAQSETEKKVMKEVFNGYAVEESILFEDPPLIEEGDPWEPLKDNVEVTALDTSKQAQTYRRQVKTGSVDKDILTTAYLPQLVQQTKVADLSDVPAWHEHTPDRLQDLTSEVAYYRGKAASCVYNPETVDEPPEDLMDLLDDRFSDKRLILDSTPNPIVAYPFVEKFKDSVPPRLEALGSDMTGSEFLEAIGQQDPALDKSAYGMQMAVGKGSSDVALFGPLTVTYDLQNEGLPIKPLEHPSGTILRPKGIGVAHGAPHPAAAKLFIDYVLSNRSVQLYEKGVFSMDYQRSNPEGAVDWANADWQTPYTQLEIETETKQIREDWREMMGVPSV